jgi:hypothetical protein
MAGSGRDNLVSRASLQLQLHGNAVARQPPCCAGYEMHARQETCGSY